MTKTEEDSEQMKAIEKRLILLTIIALMTISIIQYAFAQPAGAGVSEGATARGNASTQSPDSVNAQGGNVTELTIDGWEITTKWAGYYGNVTSEIVLENANGNTFYNWTNSNPTSGQIFASRDSTPSWGSVECANSTHITTEETDLSIATGGDSLQSTFCEACGNHTAFSVGSTNFADDNCTYRANAFNSTEKSTDWDQVLLYAGSNIVYTSPITDNGDGFNGQQYDFQLLVAENSTTDSLTTYFFYVEI